VISIIVGARPTLIEPLQRHGLISLPSSWSGPSKQILHCGDPLEGTLVVVASFAPSTACMLASGRKCHVCFDHLTPGSVRSRGPAFRAGNRDGYRERIPKTLSFAPKNQINPLSFSIPECLWDTGVGNSPRECHFKQGHVNLLLVLVSRLVGTRRHPPRFTGLQISACTLISIYCFSVLIAHVVAEA